MCPPTFFEVGDSINPWMINESVNKKKAFEQWCDLVINFISMGVDIHVINPIDTLPDMVFVANSGIAHNNTFISSNMKYGQRAPEKDYFIKWFKDAGYKIVNIRPDLRFEGRGDAIIFEDNIIGAHGFRSDYLALKIVAESLNLDLIDLELKDPRFYHLDTCFCIVSNRDAIYYPDAFKKGEIDKLEGIVNLIPITEEDACKFMCNSLKIHDTLFVPSSTSQIEFELNHIYEIKTRQIKVPEFMKSGGSIQCLSLRI